MLSFCLLTNHCTHIHTTSLRQILTCWIQQKWVEICSNPFSNWGRWLCDEDRGIGKYTKGPCSLFHMKNGWDLSCFHPCDFQTTGGPTCETYVLPLKGRCQQNVNFHQEVLPTASTSVEELAVGMGTGQNGEGGGGMEELVGREVSGERDYMLSFSCN